MDKVTSSDGTTIAFDRIGQGPPLVLVDGALCYRESGPNGPLAEALRSGFTVYTYDRRGRGDSGDTAPFAVEREVEDLAALIGVAGGSAFVYGISSGAALALEAANRGLPIPKLALYEAPFVVDDTRPPVPDDYRARLDALVAADRRADAVRLFLSKGARVPSIFVAMMRFMPAWPKLKGVAHTLPYDAEVMGDTQRGRPLPRDRWSNVTMPTLVIAGGKSQAWMRNGVRQLAEVLPDARYRTLEGQTHIVKPAALAPVLTEFFKK
jgi:pimeloyl-ACP methyl ester carboxylesterase